MTSAHRRARCVSALALLATGCAGEPRAARVTTQRPPPHRAQPAPARADDRDAAAWSEAAPGDAGPDPSASTIDAGAGAGDGPFGWALRRGTSFPTRDEALAPGARAAFAFPVDVDADGQRDEVVLVVPRAGAGEHAGARLVAFGHASDAGWSLTPLFAGEAGRHEVSGVQAFIVRRVPFVLLEVRDRDATAASGDAGAADRYAYLVLRYAPDAPATASVDGGGAPAADPALVPGSGFVQLASLATRDRAPVAFTAPAPDGSVVATSGRRQCVLRWDGARMTATRWGGLEPPARHAVALELSHVP